jgi:hypothetical protein
MSFVLYLPLLLPASNVITFGQHMLAKLCYVDLLLVPPPGTCSTDKTTPASSQRGTPSGDGTTGSVLATGSICSQARYMIQAPHMHGFNACDLSISP